MNRNKVPVEVIIVSTADDIHALAVQKQLLENHCVESAIIDMSKYPMQGSMTASQDSEGPGGCFTNPEQVDLKKVHTVWWRRPQSFIASSEIWDSRLRSFVGQECRTTFEGALYANGCRFVNERGAESKANHKIYQLAVAKRVGFKVPNTLVTNDPACISTFYKEQSQRVVFKPLTDARYHMGETRLLTPEHLDRIDLIRLAPVIFQEYIPVLYDIRLTVVGKKLFPVRILTNSGSAEIDWRLDLQTPMEPMEIDAELEDLTIKLMENLSLDFGAIDLRVTPNGETYFFEVNPSGQFLFCELTGRPKITNALAEYLTVSK